MLIEGSEQLVGGTVACEQAAVCPEQVDRLQQERPNAFDRPVAVDEADARQLDCDVRGLRERTQAVAPAGQPLPLGRDRHADMVDDDRGIRVALDQRRQACHLPSIALQVERQAIAREQAEPRPPLIVLGDVVRRVAPQGIGVPVDDLADAADARVGGLRLQQRLDAGIMERRKGDDGIGHAALGGNRLQPFGFVQRLRRVGTGIDVDDALDVPAPGVGAIVVDPIVVRDRLGHACGPLGEGRCQPGIADVAEVPEMDMGVDERNGFHGSPLV